MGIALGIVAVSTASIFTAMHRGRRAIAGHRRLPGDHCQPGVDAVGALAPAGGAGRFTRRQWLLARRPVSFWACISRAWISSLAYTTVASSVVLVSASPLFVALIAAAVLAREALAASIGRALRSHWRARR